ncbi:MAG: ATP-binding protein [Acidiferrobacterales bacterium]
MKNISSAGLSVQSAAPEHRSDRGTPSTARKSGAALLLIPLIGLGLILGLLALVGWFMVRVPEQAPVLWGGQIGLAVAGALFIGGFVLFMRRRFLQPLAYVRDWAREIEAGNLAARITEPVQGELAELTEDINSLGEALQICSKTVEAKVHQQTERLAQKTRTLEVLYDVAMAINASRDLDELLKRFLYSLKGVAHARAASVRLLTGDGQMRLVASIGLDRQVVERERVLPLDRCMCGSTIEDGKIQYQDVRECNETVGHQFFGNDNIQMIAVPLHHRGRIMGVYNLFVDERGMVAREDIKELLTSIGSHLGAAIEKARLDEEANRLSIMEERTKLAYELHDSLAQTLASVRFQVRVLDQIVHQGDESALWRELERVESSLDEAHTELRHLIAHFRAPVAKFGLVPSVEECVARFRRNTGTNAFLQNEWGEAHLPAEKELQVMRIVQESLSNIRKHSKAENVRVMLRNDGDGEYRVLVEDDGVGFDRPAVQGHAGEHIGLSIMHERAKRIGGELRIESDVGEGTRVLLVFRDPKRADFESREMRWMAE